MTRKGDRIVEQGAERLDELAQATAERGGLAAKLSDELHEDARFLRKLKPSLMVARAQGRAPKNQEPGAPPQAPSGPQLGPRPRATGSKERRDANPFVVAGAAFGLGSLLAKLIDWRGHAHPRR